MPSSNKLFMVLLGCRPKGRLTEQHDIFFGIGPDLKSLIPQMNEFWPDSGGLHIDAWREVTTVDGYRVTVEERSSKSKSGKEHLFFINLGGYKENDFEEYHYKTLSVAPTSADAVKHSKQTAFYKHTGISSPGGGSHIDDKYGIDVDDVVKIEEILNKDLKEKFLIRLIMATGQAEDTLHIGYIRLSKLK